MRGMDEEFRQHGKEMDTRHREGVREDLGRETAGIDDAGRIARHGLSENAKSTRAKKSGKQKQLSALQTLLLNPAYRAAYDDFSNFLDDEDTAIVDALTRNTREIDALRAAIEDDLSRAVTLSNGTRIFRSTETGSVENESGRKLKPEEYAHIIWPDDAPSLEEYKANQEKLKQLEQDRAALIHYQTQVIDTAKERLSDEDNPLSIEEMKEVKRQVEAYRPDFMKDKAQDQVSPEQTTTGADLDLGSFKR